MASTGKSESERGEEELQIWGGGELLSIWIFTVRIHSHVRQLTPSPKKRDKERKIIINAEEEREMRRSSH